MNETLPKTPVPFGRVLRIIYNPAFNLLLLTILAYGLFLPWMGFYWDDWPWIWRFHTYGAQAIREVDAAFRPLAGIVLWVGAQLAGENPFGWQIYNLVIRWLGGVALWWALRQIWPARKEAAFWIAGLFLVYPGFGQQFVAVNSSRHLFPLISFFLSYGLMAKAIHRKAFFGWYTWAAVGLSITTMLTTEYYYGLEFIRIVVLWVLIDSSGGSQFRKLRITLEAWLPYILPLAAIFIWRYVLSRHINYAVGILSRFLSAPRQTFLAILSTVLRDFIQVTLDAWIKLFEFPQLEVFGPRKTLMYWGIVLSCGGLALWIARQIPKDGRDRRWNLQAMGIGTVAILISGLPFWATDLNISLGFPNDRLTLPMMVGVSLLAVGLIDLLIKPRLIKISVLALIVALSAGVQVRNAASYQSDWKNQVAFFQQLIWRVPALRPGTAILTTELPLQYVTDNSLTAPLNWIYGSGLPTMKLEYAIFYLDLRLGGKVSALEEGSSITIPSDQYAFESSTSHALVLYHMPSACVRLLDPIYDRRLPAMTPEIKKALPFSNRDQIIPDVDSPTQLPEHIFGATPTGSWCYYFEKADLARQLGDWAQVAKLGDMAFQLDDSPNHASERVPFIEGYAHVGRWDTAVGLTREAILISPFIKDMLCDTWKRIDQDIPASPSKTQAIQAIQVKLACEFD